MALPLDYIIRSIFKKYFNEGKVDKLSTDAIDDIKKTIKREGGLWKDYEKTIIDLKKQAQAELMDAFRKTHDAAIKHDDVKMLEQISSTYLSKRGDIFQEVFNTIARSMKNETPEDWQSAARLALRKMKISERHIQTEVNTAENAMDNLQRFSSFRGSAEFLKYVGPAPQRPFCVSHYERVFRLSEIETMTNDFGEPAYAYCGGYNCTHRWIPIMGALSGNNVFIHDSWQQKFNSSSKQDRAILNRELSTAKTFTESQLINPRGKENNFFIEMNFNKTAISHEMRRDYDLVLNGQPAQLKNSLGTDRSIQSAISKKDQADTFIIAIPGKLAEEDRSRMRIFDFVDDGKKTVYLLSVQNKTIERFTNVTGTGSIN
jgi:hypothetical protein